MTLAEGYRFIDLIINRINPPPKRDKRFEVVGVGNCWVVTDRTTGRVVCDQPGGIATRDRDAQEKEAERLNWIYRSD
jgi:hypothetical protein